MPSLCQCGGVGGLTKVGMKLDIMGSGKFFATGGVELSIEGMKIDRFAI